MFIQYIEQTQVHLGLAYHHNFTQVHMHIATYYTYGTHQLQLKRDTRGTCKDHAR